MNKICSHTYTRVVSRIPTLRGDTYTYLQVKMIHRQSESTVHTVGTLNNIPWHTNNGSNRPFTDIQRRMYICCKHPCEICWNRPPLFTPKSDRGELSILTWYCPPPRVEFLYAIFRIILYLKQGSLQWNIFNLTFLQNIRIEIYSKGKWRFWKGKLTHLKRDKPIRNQWNKTGSKQYMCEYSTDCFAKTIDILPGLWDVYVHVGEHRCWFKAVSYWEIEQYLYNSIQLPAHKTTVAQCIWINKISYDIIWKLFEAYFESWSH